MLEDGNTFADRTLSWAIAVMLGVYVAGDSGAYLNPAITLANCVYRQLPWRRVPLYFLAQFFASFAASAYVYAIYLGGIDRFEGGYGIRTVPPSPKATAQIFCTFPQTWVGKGSQVLSEFTASAILMFVVLALNDNTNNGASKVRRQDEPIARWIFDI